MTGMMQERNPDDESTTLVGQRVGKYEVLRVVGRGGMGTVYEALNTAIQKRVAMKCIDASLAGNPDAIARFQREALAAGAVDSPHIVQIFDAGTTTDGMPFIVMELLRGRDLGSWLAELGQLRAAQALPIISQLLRGLHHAHAAGIVHRDLKPDNVFLVEREDEPATVKILDFGVSKIANNAVVSLKTLTREGTIVGTPYYMSPEQAQGYPDVDGRADLYSAGAILYECIAGRPPHVGEVYEQVIVSICMRDAEDVRAFAPAVPEALARAVGRALARERVDRYATAREMLEALLAAGPVELRALANATPSGVLRIDLGRRKPVLTTPFGSPAAVVVGGGNAVAGELGVERAAAGSVSAVSPLAALTIVEAVGDAAAPGTAAASGAVDDRAKAADAPVQPRDRLGRSTLRSADDAELGAPGGGTAPPHRGPAVFAATVRADSGVIRVGPATPTADVPARSTRRLAALVLSGLVLAAAVAVIAVATVSEPDSSDRVAGQPSELAAPPPTGAPDGPSVVGHGGASGGAVSAVAGSSGGAPTTEAPGPGRIDSTGARRPVGGPNAGLPVPPAASDEAARSTSVPPKGAPSGQGSAAPSPPPKPTGTSTGLSIMTR